MNVTKLNMSGLNMSRLNASLLNASGIGAMGCKGKATMEDKIMDSMVLWYDLAKQGATNESMAADPRLIDHSGNGHHATCYNFAWVGMSGIGGNKSYITYSNAFLQEGGIATTTGTTIHVMRIPDAQNLSAVEYRGGLGSGETLKPCFFKITGLTNGITLIGANGWDNIGIISQDGIYMMPELINPTSATIYPQLRFSNEHLSKDCDVTIQALGFYPHALVSDGVDDYAVVEGLPILTKEKGYTVITKRKHLLTKNNSCVCSNAANIGAFCYEIFQYIPSEDFPNGLCYYESWGKVSQTITKEKAINPELSVTYQTSDSYNGVMDLDKGSNKLGNDEMYVCCRDKNYNYICGIALYSLLLFDRDLTTEEIEWVKTNLITE